MKCYSDNVLIDGSGDCVILFAHGAGAGMTHPFMQTMAQGLAQQGFCVVRFNFPYMVDNAIDGKRRPANRAPKLLAEFSAQLAEVREKLKPKKVILMGKSMGGRMAAMLSATEQVDAVVCLGYPFIPLKGGEPRLTPLMEAQAPLCIIQGERDKMGNKAQCEQWPIPNNIELHWLNDGDHSFSPRKASGFTEQQNLIQAILLSTQFIRGIYA